MNNNNSNIEDLLTDEHFIKWVKQPNSDRNLYWNAWLEAHPERKSDVLLAKELITRSDFRKTEPSPEAYEEVLHKIMKKDGDDAPSPQRHAQQQYYWDARIKVAASLVLLALSSVFIIWWLYEPVVPQQQASKPTWVTKQNPAGIKSQLQLPDGTMVWLNAESTLKYPSSFDSSSRQVTLVGEAFFDVAKDIHRPFTVHSGSLNTTALGTSFNISSYPQEKNIEISLLTGQVMVSKNKSGVQEKIILVPGEQVIYNGLEAGFIKTNFDYETSLGWKEGLLVFNEASIQQIKRRLERWYGVEIQIIGKPKQTWKITGTFKNQSLERVLERLSFPKDFTFQISDNKVVINFTNQKCDSYDPME